MGWLLIATPLVATMLIWFWVGSMNLLQSPGSTLVLLLALTVVSTAVMAGIEAGRLGMGGPSDVTAKGRRREGPMAWALGLLLLWAVAFPMYLFRRRLYGVRSLLLPGVIVGSVLVASFLAMNSAIEDKKNEIRAAADDLKRRLEQPSVSEVRLEVQGKTYVALSAADRDALADEAAARYKVPPALVRGIMAAMSPSESRTERLRGRVGVMGLTPSVAKEMYVADASDDRQSIEGGARYIRTLTNEFNGDMVQIVAAYYSGPEEVHAAGDAIPPDPEAQAFVREALSLYFQTKEQERKKSPSGATPSGSASGK